MIFPFFRLCGGRFCKVQAPLHYLGRNIGDLQTRSFFSRIVVHQHFVRHFSRLPFRCYVDGELVTSQLTRFLAQVLLNLDRAQDFSRLWIFRELQVP